MGKTVYDIHQEKVAEYGTGSNTFNDFAIGTEVQVITPCQDFHFFFDETGVVIKNSCDYLGIIVEFDKPRKFENGMIQKTFNFNPEDLYVEKISNRFEIMDFG